MANRSHPGVDDQIPTRAAQGIVPPPLQGLPQPVLAAAMAGLAAAERSGIPTSISQFGGFRTAAMQRALYAHRGENPNPVAKPGESQHERGMAMDVASGGGLKEQARLAKILAPFGWKWAGPVDPVHFDYVGGGSGAGDPPPAGPAAPGGPPREAPEASLPPGAPPGSYEVAEAADPVGSFLSAQKSALPAAKSPRRPAAPAPAARQRLAAPEQIRPRRPAALPAGRRGPAGTHPAGRDIQTARGTIHAGESVPNYYHENLPAMVKGRPAPPPEADRSEQPARHESLGQYLLGEIKAAPRAAANLFMNSPMLGASYLNQQLNIYASNHGQDYAAARGLEKPEVYEKKSVSPIADPISFEGFSTSLAQVPQPLWNNHIKLGSKTDHIVRAGLDALVTLGSDILATGAQAGLVSLIPVAGEVADIAAVPGAAARVGRFKNAVLRLSIALRRAGIAAPQEKIIDLVLDFLRPAARSIPGGERALRGIEWLFREGGEEAEGKGEHMIEEEAPAVGKRRGPGGGRRPRAAIEPQAVEPEAVEPQAEPRPPARERIAAAAKRGGRAVIREAGKGAKRIAAAAVLQAPAIAASGHPLESFRNYLEGGAIAEGALGGLGAAGEGVGVIGRGVRGFARGEGDKELTTLYSRLVHAYATGDKAAQQAIEEEAATRYPNSPARKKAFTVAKAVGKRFSDAIVKIHRGLETAGVAEPGPVEKRINGPKGASARRERQRAFQWAEKKLLPKGRSLEGLTPEQQDEMIDRGLALLRQAQRERSGARTGAGVPTGAHTGLKARFLSQVDEARGAEPAMVAENKQTASGAKTGEPVTLVGFYQERPGVNGRPEGAMLTSTPEQAALHYQQRGGSRPAGVSASEYQRHGGPAGTLAVSSVHLAHPLVIGDGRVELPAGAAALPDRVRASLESSARAHRRAGRGFTRLAGEDRAALAAAGFDGVIVRWSKSPGVVEFAPVGPGRLPASGEQAITHPRPGKEKSSYTFGQLARMSEKRLAAVMAQHFPAGQRSAAEKAQAHAIQEFRATYRNRVAGTATRLHGSKNRGLVSRATKRAATGILHPEHHHDYEPKSLKNRALEISRDVSKDLGRGIVDVATGQSVKEDKRAAAAERGRADQGLRGHRIRADLTGESGRKVGAAGSPARPVAVAGSPPPGVKTVTLDGNQYGALQGAQANVGFAQAVNQQLQTTHAHQDDLWQKIARVWKLGEINFKVGPFKEKATADWMLANIALHHAGQGNLSPAEIARAGAEVWRGRKGATNDPYLRELLDIGAQNPAHQSLGPTGINPGGNRLARGLKAVAGATPNAIGKLELAMKLALARRLGQATQFRGSPAGAAAAANKLIGDYSQVPQWARKLDQYALVPFLAVQLKNLPILVRGTVLHPAAVAPFIYIPNAVGQVVSEYAQQEHGKNGPPVPPGGIELPRYYDESGTPQFMRQNPVTPNPLGRILDSFQGGGGPLGGLVGWLSGVDLGQSLRQHRAVSISQEGESPVLESKDRDAFLKKTLQPGLANLYDSLQDAKAGNARTPWGAAASVRDVVTGYLAGETPSPLTTPDRQRAERIRSRGNSAARGLGKLWEDTVSAGLRQPVPGEYQDTLDGMKSYGAVVYNIKAARKYFVLLLMSNYSPAEKKARTRETARWMAALMLKARSMQQGG